MSRWPTAPPRLLAWLRANNLNPDDIPIDATIVTDWHVLGPPTITTTVCVRNADGDFVWNGETAARRQITVPQLISWQDFPWPPPTDPPGETPNATTTTPS